MEILFSIILVILALCICAVEFRHMKKRVSTMASSISPVKNTAKLVVIDGPQKGEGFVLASHAIIGRGYEHGINLLDKKVSFKHAIIVSQPLHYSIFDLGSSNKTHVNDNVIDFTPLHHGDKILVGNTSLIFLESKSSHKETDFVPSVSMQPTAFPTVSIVENKAACTETILGKCSPDTMLEASTREDIGKLRQKFQFICQISNMVGVGLSIENILKETIQALGKLFEKVERGVIFLTDLKTRQLTPANSFNFGKNEEEVITVSSTILSEAMKQRMALMCSNAMSDQRFEVGHSVVAQRIKLAMCCPLIVQDEIVGAIYMDSTLEMGKFKQEDLTLLAAVGSQIAIFIKNVRLHESLLQTEKLERELSIAQEIQKSFLPSRFPETDKFKFAACTRPARYVGGDFYDIMELADGRIGITVGDVSGKGAGAALCMASLVSEFRFLARSSSNVEDVFEHLNNDLVLRSTRGMFVTMLYLVVDVEESQITYVNAGHLEPLVLENSSLHYFPQADAPPLGIVKNMKYKALRLPIVQGSTIILYTDGITEAMNSKREQYGKSRLEQALSGIYLEEEGKKKERESTARIDSVERDGNRKRTSQVSPHSLPPHQMSPQELIEYISTDVNNFCGSAQAHDDFTIAGFQTLL